MEKNEVSMILDVKVDIANKKNETGRLKNWTKCTVKIETIKSIPSLLRIKFLQNTENESENLSIPIHVPGVQVRLSNSRTKSCSYGITWKHNRKRCHIFFAFETKLTFEMHMKWMRESLKNLELYRREILETKRKSRDGSTFSNLQRTTVLPIKTVQDILGPLPKIPDKRESINWTRRISTVSGIYEEIHDSESFRRFSQASGIYEEMKPPKEDDLLFKMESPPELPTRSRINTFENDFFGVIPRSNTNPESITASKKNKIFFQGLQNTLLGKRSKRSASVSENKVSTTEDLIDTTKKLSQQNSSYTKFESHVYQNVDANFENLICVSTVKNNILKTTAELTNRNSFSSPDLSKMISISTDKILISPSTFDMCEPCQSSQNIYFANNDLPKELEVKTDTIKCVHKNELFNISDRINETFNFSVNSSTINLVGANLNIENTGTIHYCHNRSRVIEDISGYCSMAPIKREIRDYETSNEKLLSESIKTLNHCRKLSDSDKENIDNSIELRYNIETMNNKTEKKNVIDNSGNVNNLHTKEIMRLNVPKTDLVQNHYQTPKKNTKNIDEKISSYYPNKCDLKKFQNLKPSNSNFVNKICSKPLKLSHLEKSHSNNGEDLYKSSLSAQRNMKSTIEEQPIINENLADIYTIKRLTTLKACKISENVYSVKRLDDQNEIKEFKEKKFIYSKNELFPKTPEQPTSSNISFGTLLQGIDFKFDDSRNSNVDSNSVKVSKSSRNKSKHNKTYLTPELNTTKKVTSLPRFKKIDFSPLKLKINNVLQRNNTEGY